MAFSGWPNIRCGCKCHWRMEELQRPRAEANAQHMNRDIPQSTLLVQTAMCAECFEESNIADGEHFAAYVLQEAP